MPISIAPLQRAFLSLKNAVNRALLNPNDLEVRDACIQRFEYTYELCIKTIKRYIEQEMPLSENVDRLNYRDFIRLSHEIGLLVTVTPWFTYREARNQTSHAYDETKAREVYAVISPFISDVECLLHEFEQRL